MALTRRPRSTRSRKLPEGWQGAGTPLSPARSFPPVSRNEGNKQPLVEDLRRRNQVHGSKASRRMARPTGGGELRALVLGTGRGACSQPDAVLDGAAGLIDAVAARADQPSFSFQTTDLLTQDTRCRCATIALSGMTTRGVPPSVAANTLVGASSASMEPTARRGAGPQGTICLRFAPCLAFWARFPRDVRSAPQEWNVQPRGTSQSARSVAIDEPPARRTREHPCP